MKQVDAKVWRIREGKPDLLINDKDEIELTMDGVEKFTTHQRENKPVKITLNNKPISLVSGSYTGSEIKLIAIEQKVDIKQDFVLSKVSDNDTSNIIGDDDKIQIKGGEKFRAIANDESSYPNMTDEVELALDKLKREFPKATVTPHDNGNGGVTVLIEGVELGPPFISNTTWFGFEIPYNCDHADIYPHYTSSDLILESGERFGNVKVMGVQNSHRFQGRGSIQISRRNNHPPPRDAATKLKFIIHWLTTPKQWDIRND